MRPRRLRTALALVLIVSAAICAAAAGAADQPLRSGTVLTKMDIGDFTYVKAADGAGKEFWVLISICTIGAGGRIDVLAGTRYDRMRTKDQVVMEDVYVGERVRIGDAEVIGFGTHKLPEGCVVME